VRHGAGRIWVLFLEAQCRQKVVAAVGVADGDATVDDGGCRERENDGGCRERDNDSGGKKAG